MIEVINIDMFASRLLGRLRQVLGAISVLSFAIALFDFVTGGVVYFIGPIRVSTRDPFRPVFIGIVSKGIAIWIDDRTLPRGVWDHMASWSRWLVSVTAALSVIITIHFGIFAAGGADAYGYVSQATLWSHGQLTLPEPLADISPPLGPSIAPLGYQRALNPNFIVPIYPAGLPITMALALRIGGLEAVYFVVPLFGGMAVWLTYWIGHRVWGPRTGVMAAIILAFSPIFVFQCLEPMSDVPATAWWLATWALALCEFKWAPWLAGTTAGAALLTRPNLAPLTFVFALLIVRARPRVRRALMLTIGILPGCLAIYFINKTLYGSPFASGYGAFDTLFKASWLIPNLRHYSRWLLQLQTVFVCLAFAAPFITATEGFSDENIRSDERPITWLMLAFFGVVFFCYLFYIPYDTWPFLRFLLPGIPFLVVLSSAVAIQLIDRLPYVFKGVTVFALCATICFWYFRKADELKIFYIGESEHRYITVGEYVDHTLPRNAVVITVIQSGSLRLYGHRRTLRWDLISPQEFDRTVHALNINGYVPYILLEHWEESDFRHRFEAALSPNLNGPPVADLPGPIRVRIYSTHDP